MKKFLITLGSIASITLPFAAVVSCSDGFKITVKTYETRVENDEAIVELLQDKSFPSHVDQAMITTASVFIEACEGWEKVTKVFFKLELDDKVKWYGASVPIGKATDEQVLKEAFKDKVLSDTKPII